MALQPLASKPATATIEKEFAVKTGKVLPTPRRDRVKNGEDASSYALNIMFYGPYGTGKTYSAEGLIRHGKKVLFVITDLGDNGVVSVKLALKKKGLAHLAKNYKIISLNNFDEMSAFIQEPAEFFPDIYSWDPDFVMWDSLSYFQQTDLMKKAGEDIKENNEINIDKGSKEKEVSTLREEGIKFELADYAVVRNLTVRTVKAFCRVHNKVTGKLWHKLVTCQESVRSKGADQGGGFVDSVQPLMTGAGGVLTCGAFDLIIRTMQEGDAFKYSISRDKNATTKNRGFSLEPKMDADFYKVWSIICDDLDIVDGAVDEKNIAPVLLVEETA